MKMSCKLYFLIIFFILFIRPIFGHEFRIAEVGPNYVMANLKVPKGKPRPELEMLMVYDVFEKMEIIGGRRVFVNYVDSVYLREVKKEELYFGFTWEGEKRHFKPNYILSSTDRYYTFPGTPFDQVIKEPDIQIGNAEEEEEERPPFKFSFMVLTGYTLLHTIRYDGSEDQTFGPGYITADAVFFLYYDFGLRITCASQHTFEDIYVQASGISYKDIADNFLKIYTELGVGYPFTISENSTTDPLIIVVAQYGLLFDFKALFEWGFFAIDLYVNANFPVNTILEDMYLNYGLKAYTPLTYRVLSFVNPHCFNISLPLEFPP